MKRHINFVDQMYLYLKDCKLVDTLRHYSIERGDLGMHSATMLALIAPNPFRTAHPDMHSLRVSAMFIKAIAGPPVMEAVDACADCGRHRECCVYLAFEAR